MSNPLLCQSNVAEHVWALYLTDQVKFKRRVVAHFLLGMPDWKVVKANYPERIIWIQKVRGDLL